MQKEIIAFRIMKTCFKCETSKPLSEFYTHRRMADGHLNKCKSCAKSDRATHYRRPGVRERVLAYHKNRMTDPGQRARHKSYLAVGRERHPEHYKARVILNHAIRDRRIVKKPCEVCGCEKTQGHHGDYSRPLDVQWFCFKHHREVAHGQTVTANF